VFCGRTLVSAERHGRSNATVDAIVMLDGERVICAGAVAATIREAVDQLAVRLHTRLTSLRARD
jgi:ribosome-associated translation inhibitor RaiA